MKVKPLPHSSLDADLPLPFPPPFQVGNLGVFDAQSHKEGDDGEELPDISHFKVHSRTISTFTFDPVSATSIYTASYDGSVRKFDLATGIASEVFVGDEHDGLSGVEVPYPNLVYFATLDGRLGRRDLRARRTEMWTLSEKKIGGFSLHPRAPHLAATGVSCCVPLVTYIYILIPCSRSTEPSRSGT